MGKGKIEDKRDLDRIASKLRGLAYNIEEGKVDVREFRENVDFSKFILNNQGEIDIPNGDVTFKIIYYDSEKDKVDEWKEYNEVIK